MKVAIAYSVVVAIWATTPLAIQWSNSSLSFIAAVSARMILALLVCAGILLLTRQPLVRSTSDWRAFAAGALGLFPNMLLVYWSAQFIPSGLIPVILGVYPFMVGGLSYFVLRENVFTPTRIVALIIALLGLMVIHYDQLRVGAEGIWGVLGILGSAAMFSVSSVWLKAVGATVRPMQQATGSLILAAPLFAVTWWIFDGRIPDSVDTKSASGILYLTLAGSVIGHTLFFYILRHCTVSTVSLVTLITPLMAIALGALVENEFVSLHALIGAGMIILSLGVYQGLIKRLFKAFEGIKL